MFKTYEELASWCRARLSKRKAALHSTCGQCRRGISPGDMIARPFLPRLGRGVPRNRAISWYCTDCAEHLQRGVDCGALVAGAPWLTKEDKDAFFARPAVVAWMREDEEKKHGCVGSY